VTVVTGAAAVSDGPWRERWRGRKRSGAGRSHMEEIEAPPRVKCFGGAIVTIQAT